MIVPSLCFLYLERKKNVDHSDCTLKDQKNKFDNPFSNLRLRYSI
jgi:hypothetical protein